MELTINHEVRVFEQLPVTLTDLVQAEISGNTAGVAVAVNSQVVPKHVWGETGLKNKDTVLIIMASQGG